jgi:hypothetical protein
VRKIVARPPTVHNRYAGTLHVTAVVITELREGGSIISAMFTGRKTWLRSQPMMPRRLLM